MSVIDFLFSPFGFPIVLATVVLALPLIIPRRRAHKHRGLRS